MKFLSVCSGIEAASEAWKPMGWEAVAFSEIDPFPRAVLRELYPDVPNWGDMTRYKEWPDASFDVLCGGTPCQSFSVAGLRKGLDDPRGDLMLTFGAIAGRYRPRWLVWENVPGVLSSNEGRDFGSFLGLLGLLGYGFAYRVLDAQYFGVAQRRKRVFVVGHLGNWRYPAAVLFDRHSLSGHPAPSREKGQGITGPIAGCSNGGGANGPGRTADDADSLVASVAPTLGKESFSPTKSSSGQMEDFCIAFDTNQITHPANRSNPQPGGPSPSIARWGDPPAVAFDARQSDVIQYGEKTGPLDTDAHTIGIHQAARVRRLTPKECERLQGFPDGYTAITYRGKPAADGPRYKALGNSWAVPCARWIGQRIERLESLLTSLQAPYTLHPNQK